MNFKAENRTDKYLTFTLANEDYGIAIRTIKEIIGMISIIPVPKTLDYIKGVVNLRGKVISVTNLGLNDSPESSFVFWAETTALVAFGVSWLNKGEAIYPDR